MTQDERINKVEVQVIDMRIAISALMETVTLHQYNFETIQRNFETMQRNFNAIILDMRSDMLRMQSDIEEIQKDTRGLQTENRRILDILQNRHPEED